MLTRIVQNIVEATDYPPPIAIDRFGALWTPLAGKTIRLVPMTQADAPRLHAAFADDDLWGWSTVKQPPPNTPEDSEEWVRAALAEATARTQAPFILETLDGQLAGTTRYMDLRWHDAGVEIGHTMVFAPFRRTHVNTEMKYVLLKRAFEDFGFARVQLKTDARNVRSRTAILRIGAQFEGVIRCMQRRYTGEIRDTAFFSVTFKEWPNVRKDLEAKLAYVSS